MFEPRYDQCRKAGLVKIRVDEQDVIDEKYRKCKV